VHLSLGDSGRPGKVEKHYFKQGTQLFSACTVPCCIQNKDEGSIVIGQVLQNGVSARYILVSIYVSGEKSAKSTSHMNLSVLHCRPVD